METHRDGCTISTDRARIDRDLVRRFLSRSYWARGIPRKIVDRSIENALCFGVYQRNRQLGFARVITDRATFAYLADVFVLEEYRGKGLGVWLVETIMSHPELQNLRRWMLATADAHGLYRKFGFTALSRPERIMEILVPNAYGAQKDREA
jgi:GNAT superfamily N-acetyltransferase